MAAPTQVAAAGVVLVGGRSSRMGTPKAALPWHGSTLLRRTVGVLGRAVTGPLVVVRAPGQPLPALPGDVDVVEDPAEGLGPLQGIAAGLAAVGARAGAAFVSSTDLPLLHPAFVRRVLGALAADPAQAGPDVVLPVARGHRQPLAAAYRVALGELVAELLAAGELRPPSLLRRCRTLRLDEAALLADRDLAAADPDLESVVNVNSPEEYRDALRRPAPAITVRCEGAPAPASRGRTVRAATLAGAAAAVGLRLDRGVTVGATVDGEPVEHDPEFPLVRGDTVTFGVP